MEKAYAQQKYDGRFNTMVLYYCPKTIYQFIFTLFKNNHPATFWEFYYLVPKK